MYILKQQKTALICGLLSAIFFNSVSAQSSEDSISEGVDTICDGTWRVELDTSSPLDETEGLRGVWIPGSINLNNTLARCATELVLKQSQGGELSLRGSSSSHRYELKNTSRQPLAVAGENDYILPLLGKQQSDFWVYIPGGQNLSPGIYQAMLDAEIKSASAAPALMQTYSFNYQVMPYVRVKLENLRNSWLQSTDTSVRIDLGDLTQKNNRNLPMYIESNGLVSMAIESSNQGKLINTRNKEHEIPYQLFLNNKSINLMDKRIIQMNNQPFNLQQTNISFQNTATPDAQAGQYKDIITVNLDAR